MLLTVSTEQRTNLFSLHLDLCRELYMDLTLFLCSFIRWIFLTCYHFPGLEGCSTLLSFLLHMFIWKFRSSAKVLIQIGLSFQSNEIFLLFRMLLDNRCRRADENNNSKMCISIENVSCFTLKFWFDEISIFQSKYLSRVPDSISRSNRSRLRRRLKLKFIRNENKSNTAWSRWKWARSLASSYWRKKLLRAREWSRRAEKCKTPTVAETQEMKSKAYK